MRRYWIILTVLLACGEFVRAVAYLARLPRKTGRKVGMTSSQHGPYVLGYTHATMGGTEGCEGAIRS